jgi:triacylglycerol esterase/lipase EstA (alpha/beta hydrolase family)
VFAAAVVLTATAGGAGAQPVGYDFYDGARAELANPGGSFPGSNDFSCRPAAAHPNPVVLVHGTGGNRQTNWATMIPALRNEGYCVFALTYGTLPGTAWPVSGLGGLTRMESSAAQLNDFIEQVRSATGSAKVDLVGHSEGTLMPTYYVKYLGGADKIDKYVSLAPYWKGQDSAGYLQLEAVASALGFDPDQVLPCPECAQENYGSPFMQMINSGGSPYVPGIAYTNVMTTHDGIVEPWSDGLVPGPGTTNIVLQDSCPADRSDHLSIVSSPRSVAVVLGALDPDHAPPVPCVPVAPGLGL